MKIKRLHTRLLWLVCLVLAACEPRAPEAQLEDLPRLDSLPFAMPPALQNAIAAVKTSERDSQLNGRLGMQLQAHLLFEEAAVLYGRARFLDNKTFRWAYLHGLALRTTGRPEAATAALSKALEMRPDHPGAQFERARLAQANGDNTLADQLYSRLVSRNPTFAQAFQAYGKFLLEQGQTERGIEMLEASLGLYNRYGTAHYSLALAYRELGQPDKALLHSKLFERYREYQPPAYDNLLIQIASMSPSDPGGIARAMSLVAQGKAREAVGDLEALVAASPRSLTPRIPLIDIYGQLGEFDKAQAHVNRSLDIDPASTALHDNIGVMYLRQGLNDEAITSFQQAIELDPEFAGLHRNLGIAFYAAGQHGDAIASYRMAVDLDPYDRQSIYRLASLLVERDRPDEAIAIIEPITAYTHRDTARYYQLLGSAYAAIGDWTQAVSALERAVALANQYRLSDVAPTALAQLEYARRRAK